MQRAEVRCSIETHSRCHPDSVIQDVLQRAEVRCSIETRVAPVRHARPRMALQRAEVRCSIETSGCRSDFPLEPRAVAARGSALLY